MRVPRHTDASAFHDRILAALEPAERENNVLLGAVRRLVRSPDEAAVMASVEEDERLACAALLTPPFNLLISPAPPAAFEALGEQLHAWRIALPGVIALAPVSDAFAAIWQRRAGCRAERGKEMQFFALGAAPQAPAVPGGLRAALTGDIPLLIAWAEEFFCEAGLPPHEHDVFVAHLNETPAPQHLWLWEVEGQRVSMLRHHPTTTRTARIGLVYTPPAHRGRGFASAAVAEVSRRLLASGRSWCLLFADVENATSTALYRRLGYEDICLYREYRFT
jgi:uncharacterized protein